MMLINTLLSHATEMYWDELTSELDRLNVQRAVIRLMSSHTIEDLTSSILDFQGNIVRVIYQKKTRLVEPELDEEQHYILEYIWASAKLEGSEYGQITNGRSHPNGLGSNVKWKKLGFETEDLRQEFAGTGMLGLECLVS